MITLARFQGKRLEPFAVSYFMLRCLPKLKDPFSSVSHWIGSILAVIGTAVLLFLARGQVKMTIAFAIYGATLIVLYVASGLYHSYCGDERREAILRKLDHAGIFLLISGSYVPVCLLALNPIAGDTLLVLQAICALVGIAGTFLLKKFPEVLNVVLYLLMGWMALPMVGYMVTHWPSYAVWLLAAGGVTYTIGAVIFSIDKPHLAPGRFSAHDLWHLFVLGGSACHFFLMSTFIAVSCKTT